MHKNEIERKFFVREMPELTGIKPIKYERFILEACEDKEVRITKINDVCIKEIKTKSSELGRATESVKITAADFDSLKKQAIGSLLRDKYVIPGSPEIHLQVYHGEHDGLVRAEVEFGSELEARAYTPEEWMGEEMTGMPIARDSQLIGLRKAELEGYLRQ
jgi:adenylate cyclase